MLIKILFFFLVMLGGHVPVLKAAKNKPMLKFKIALMCRDETIIHNFLNNALITEEHVAIARKLAHEDRLLLVISAFQRDNAVPIE